MVHYYLFVNLTDYRAVLQPHSNLIVPIFLNFGRLEIHRIYENLVWWRWLAPGFYGDMQAVSNAGFPVWYPANPAKRVHSDPENQTTLRLRICRRFEHTWAESC
jgi:hypothetical protein